LAKEHSVASCPSADDLTGFIQSELPEVQAAAIADHLDHCAACQSMLARLTESPELEKWRAAARVAAPAHVAGSDDEPLNGHEPTGAVLDR
jgi:hypothetical protein